MLSLCCYHQKARKSRQNVFRDKTAYVWALDYRWRSIAIDDRRSRGCTLYAALAPTGALFVTIHATDPYHFFLQFLHGLRNYFQLVWDWNQVSAKMLGMLCSRCLGVFMWRMVVRAPDGCSPDQQWPHPPSQIVRGLTLCTDWSNYDWQWSTIELFLKHPNDGHNSWSSQDG